MQCMPFLKNNEETCWQQKGTENLKSKPTAKDTPVDTFPQNTKLAEIFSMKKPSTQDTPLFVLG